MNLVVTFIGYFWMERIGFNRIIEKQQNLIMGLLKKQLSLTDRIVELELELKTLRAKKR